VISGITNSVFNKQSATAKTVNQSLHVKLQSTQDMNSVLHDKSDNSEGCYEN